MTRQSLIRGKHLANELTSWVFVSGARATHVDYLHLSNVEMLVDRLGSLEELVLHDVLGEALGLDLVHLSHVGELLLLDKVSLLESDLLSVVLFLLELLLLGFELDLKFNIIELSLLCELKPLSAKDIGQLSLTDLLQVVSLLPNLSDLKLLGEELTLGLLDSKGLLSFEDLHLDVTLCLDPVVLFISGNGLLVDDLVSISLDSLGFHSVLLSELGLEVNEETLGGDSNVDDLNSFYPDTPASDDLLHLILDTISEHVSVFPDIDESHVCNPVSDDRYGHTLKLSVSNTRGALVKVVSERLVASEWTIGLSVDTPDEDAIDLYTLHL